MTLRRSIFVSYFVTLGLSLLVIGFWSWFEFQEIRETFKNGGLSAVEDEGPVEESFEIVVFGGLPAAILGVLMGALLLQRALRPVRDLTEILEKTNASNLDDRAPRSGNGDELDRLAAVFNGMKERLAVSFTQVREFTLHASHELKTPLTIMHGTLEQMLSDAGSSAIHRERIASLLEEVQRLSTIVGQLTFLAKADGGLLADRQLPVELEQLVKDVTEDALMLGHGLGIKVTLAECDAVQVTGDRMRLRQLLLNLADNAVKHNHKGGEVTLSLKAVGEKAEFQIINTGPVLPPELRGRVFERFFRGDSSHSASVEGSGLGLSIAHSICLNHGGTLVMEATDDGRTCVTLSLPRR
ncbi:signal transduction histidine kinase [Prosthecobacter fusiformis]|uniref:histidine kinase n=1 Tax=Prosthecobacter fusiformis TaxID=48464 RepID=A0A4V3FI65_9BACT|nr:HAMP domain-containing sensor histidine kinase [Prosthecobacter fusiformis]TDU81233.1 signal transduction histidine kinase [Prosthecobacter fusiformis]